MKKDEKGMRKTLIQFFTSLFVTLHHIPSCVSAITYAHIGILLYIISPIVLVLTFSISVYTAEPESSALHLFFIKSITAKTSGTKNIIFAHFMPSAPTTRLMANIPS